MKKTLIKNGLIINSTHNFYGDILLDNGKILAIGSNFDEKDVDIYDAANKFVFPGIVDPHVQFEVNFGKFPMTDGFNTGTIAAAAGGVTTIIDFADQPKGVTIRDYLKKRRQEADGSVNVDYSLHMSITDTKVGSIDDISRVVEDGIPSFKLYMAYSRRDRMVNEGQIDAIMAIAAKHDAICGIHGENDNMVEYLIDSNRKQGKTDVKYFTSSRPDTAEIIAVNTAILLAERNNCILYVHHVSCKGTLDAIKAGRSRGVKIYAETCPAYLLLNEDVYNKHNAQIYVLNPPLRSERDRYALWDGIYNGEIDTIGTDHCSYTLSQKMKNKDNYDCIPAGHPGVEISLPLMYTYGVANGKMPINKLIHLMSYNPAKIFGLSDRKGILAPGYDADIVIFDPKKKWKMSSEKLKMNVDFTNYDNWDIIGKVEATYLRGMKIFENDMFLGPYHQGRFLPAKPAPYSR